MTTAGTPNFIAFIFIVLFCYLFVAFDGGEADAQLLYDNIGLPPDTNFHPDPGDTRAAQQFLTGDFGGVEAVSLPIFSPVKPTGELQFEIWDDDGGQPGKLVAPLGAIDVTTVASFPPVTIAGPVTGLRPNTPYYVVMDLRDVDLSNGTFFLFGLQTDVGTNGAANMMAEVGQDWVPMSDFIGSGANYWQMSITGLPVAASALRAGDADQDMDFDQFDLVQVQVAAKYLTGQSATWGEGDWDGAPGGSAGNPPVGDGVFDQIDIIAALAADTYLTGPYAGISPDGQAGDGQTSVIYNANTGELAVDAPAGTELTSINIDSAAGIFTGDAAQNLGGSFDNDADANLFKATFGSSFGSLSFGNVVQNGLSEEFVLSDLSVIGSLAGGGDLGDVDLIYVPEPASAVLMTFGVVFASICMGRYAR